MPPLKSNEQALRVRQDAEEKFSPEDLEAAKQALKANAGKNFVQRITNASDWPVMQNPDGSYSSHRMANSDNYAYPTIVYDKTTNQLVKPEDPIAEAKRTGEFIEFPNPEAAEKFAEGAYKGGMDTGLMQQMMRRMWK